MKEDRLQAIEFSDLPVHDSCWAITTGRDGRIYTAVGGINGGLGVYIVAYDPERDEMEYLTDVALAIGEPPDNGRATHAEIHYCMIPGSDGMLYCATHSSGPPLGDAFWRPWNTWDDVSKSFSGFHIFIVNPRTGAVEDRGIQAPGEGSRCMAFDEKRGKLFGVTYPRDHFYIYHLQGGIYKDLGRIGDMNPQSIWLDRGGNAYTADEYGYIIRCDAEKEELCELGIRLPYAEFRDGTHSTVYDMVPSPDGEGIYGVTWSFDNRLFYHNPYEGSEGRIVDLGRAYGPEYEGWNSLDDNHTGGLIFGDDGLLYFATNVWWKEPKGMYLMRFNTKTEEREELMPFMIDGEVAPYVSRATKDFAGNLYFAECVRTPTRIYKFTPEYVKKESWKPRWPLIRSWG
ncbi:MAG: hypothetical protein M1371_05615 [Actinobacteria bacterium]|nr:hypothetical protein [Actinomycetota bacterium]